MASTSEPMAIFARLVKSDLPDLSAAHGGVHDFGAIAGSGSALRPASPSAPDLTVDEVFDRSTWDRLVDPSPHPTLTQTFSYGVGKAAQGWHVRRVVFRLRGHAIAFAQILEARVAGLRVLSRINRGPVMLVTSPPMPVVSMVYRTLREQWGRWYRGPLSVAPELPAGTEMAEMLEGLGYRERPNCRWTSARVALSRTEDELWRAMSSGFRNRLRKAEHAGLELRIAHDSFARQWMIERHLENKRIKRFRGPGAAFLEAHFASEEDITIFQALLDGRPIAGMAVAGFGNTSEYQIGWFGDTARRVNAGNYLMWHVIKEMSRRGFAIFDVGGLAPGHGYTQFKRTMNPIEYQLVGEWVCF